MRNNLSDRVESGNLLEGGPARFWEVQGAIGRVELGRRLWKEEQQTPQAAQFLVPLHGLSSRTGQPPFRSEGAAQTTVRVGAGVASDAYKRTKVKTGERQGGRAILRSRLPRFPSAFVVFVVWSGCGVGNWRKLTSIWSRPALTFDHVKMGGVNIGVGAARYAHVQFSLGHFDLVSLTWIHRL